MSQILRNESHFSIGGYILTQSNLFAEMVEICKKGDFSYSFFKEGFEQIPDFLKNLKYNFSYINRSKTNINNQINVELEKRVILYSTFILRELVQDIDKNYRSIQKVDYVIGSQILIQVLKYLEDHKINRLQFANYHLYDTPLSTIVHLILNCKPLKKEQENRILLKLKGFSQTSLLLVGIFAYHWRVFFEKALNMKGFALFIGEFYKLNGNIISQQSENQFNSRGEILKMNPMSMSDGLLTNKAIITGINELGKENIDLIISIIEKQKFNNYDILFFLKSMMGEDSNITEKLFHEKDSVAVRAYGITPFDRSLKEKYLDLNHMKNEIQTKDDIISKEKNRLATDIALRNLAFQSGRDLFTFALLREQEIDKERTRIFQNEYQHKKHYCYKIRYKKNKKPEIVLFKKNKVLQDHSKLSSLKDYQMLAKACLDYEIQIKRLIKLFEKMMCSYTSVKNEQLNIILQNDMLKDIFRHILLINTDLEIGYYHPSGTLFSPLKNDFFELGKKLKIAHRKDLQKLNLLDSLERIVIKNDYKEYFSQIFRESYSLENEEKKIFAIKRFINKKVNGKKFLTELSERDWYCSFYDYCFKEIRNGDIRVKMTFMNKTDNLIAENELVLDELSFTDKTEEPLCLSSIPPIYFSEIVRDISMASEKSRHNQEERNVVNEELKKRYLKKYIEINNINNINLNERYVHIKGSSNKYKIGLHNEMVYIMNEYHEWNHCRNLRINNNQASLPLNPFSNLMTKIQHLINS